METAQETPKPNARCITVDFSKVGRSLAELKQSFPPIHKPTNGYGVIELGKVIPKAKLPAAARKLFEPRGESHDGNYSSQDEAFVCSMLNAGHSPQDTLATFLDSPRGRDAADRHKIEDYSQRTVAKAVAFVGRKNEAIAPADSSDWREYFRSRSELDQRPLKFAIDRLVPEEGITGIGGLSGHAKTWVMLSMAKQMVKGGYLWGKFKTNQYPVLYLIPEVGDRSFFHRMNLLDIPDGNHFLVRTMSQGKTLPMSSTIMLEAAKGRVVFLDTLPRFTEGKDEQQARDMAALGETILALLQAGAMAVVFAHHSPKSSREKDDMDLENVFRGSGDIGAIMSAGHGVRMLDASKCLIQVECVKPRDFEPSKPFQLEGRPWIDKEGDFHMVKKPGECGTLAGEKKKKAEGELLVTILNVVQKTPGLSGNKIYQQVGGHRSTVIDILRKGVGQKWSFEKGGYHAIE